MTRVRTGEAPGRAAACNLARPDGILEVTADAPLRRGRQSLGVAHTTGPDGSSLHLLQDDAVAATLSFEGTFPMIFQHGGAGLRLGHDIGLPVSERYTTPSSWNGVLHSVRLQTPTPPRPDPLNDLRAALHSD